MTNVAGIWCCGYLVVMTLFPLVVMCHGCGKHVSWEVLTCIMGAGAGPTPLNLRAPRHRCCTRRWDARKGLAGEGRARQRHV